MSEISDITTDAVPNPRNEEVEHAENENANNNDVPHNNDQFSKSSPFSSTKKKNNPKKYNQPSASATIINISKSREIHIGNNLTINMNGNDKLKKTDIPETSAIKSLKQSKIPITKKDLLFAATHMDSEWKGVARALNIGEGQISQFIADNQIYGTKEVIYQVLLDWYQNDPAEANVGNLCTILWDNCQKDVVRRWSQRIE
ncbi:unnamed protein product [Psylliodes chrysocephalus]|uniref:Death domain-containing protein n=1 Tax=Psylliodes chrysocephalus TaxID=3402493 RepID=A0A9P0CRL8_9CUCU|nr:unnamed protein product [Psylliodes chrysocephala]